MTTNSPEALVKSEPDRRCDCGTVVASSKVVKTYFGPFPTSKMTLYECQTCGDRFTIEAATIIVFYLIVAAVLGAVSGWILVGTGGHRQCLIGGTTLMGTTGIGLWTLGLLRDRWRFPRG